MKRQWCPTLMAALIFGVVGCAQTVRRSEQPKVDGGVAPAAYHPAGVARPAQPMAVAMDPAPSPPEPEPAPAPDQAK